MTKRYRNRFIALVLSLLLIVPLLAGCSSSSKGVSDQIMQEAGSADLHSYTNSAQNISGDAGEFTAATTQTTSASPQRKLVKNASMEVESKDGEALHKQLQQFVSSVGGYEFSMSARESDYGKTISVVFKVPPEQLDAFLQFAQENASVQYQNVSTDDISAQYYDAEIRLNTMKSSLSQYYALLEKAANVTEILEIQQQIDSMTVEIEALEGSLKLWDKMVAESTVDMSIVTKKNLTDREGKGGFLSGSEMWQSMKNGFLRVCSTLLQVFQFLLVALVSFSPIWLPLLLVLFVVVALTRRKRKKALLPTDSENSETKTH